jgi:hypothetical protein
MIVRNLAETSKRRIHTGYAASVVGCIFSSFGLRYSLRKPLHLRCGRSCVELWDYEPLPGN